MSIRSQKMAQKAYPLVDNMREEKLFEYYSKKVKPENLEKLKQDCKRLEKDYRTQALNLPIMILQSGLIQTVGFLLAKGKAKNEKEDNQSNKKENPLPNQYLLILYHLACLLDNSHTMQTNQDCPEDSFDDMQKKIADMYQKNLSIHQEVLNTKLTDYQLLTHKALDASSLLKRYAQALLKDPKDQENGNE